MGIHILICPDLPGLRPSPPSLCRKLGNLGLRIRKLGRSGHLEPDFTLQMTHLAQFAKLESRFAQFVGNTMLGDRCRKMLGDGTAPEYKKPDRLGSGWKS